MTPTKTHILDIAEKLAKQRGFDGFSYRDISKIIGIKTAGIHYHFPAKDDLAVALIERYIVKMADYFAQIEESQPRGFDRIELFFQQLIEISGREFDFCLCGMLAADRYSISKVAHAKLDIFFFNYEQWLEKTLLIGIEDGSVANAIEPHKEAVSLVALTEGAMLVARVRHHYLAEVLNFTLTKLRGKARESKKRDGTRK